MLCSICFNDIPSVNGWDSGNNAAPVNHGRCCNDCDNNVVFPARLNMMMRGVSNEVFMAMQREQFESMQRVMAAQVETAEVQADG
jgi:hypothetical protein